MPYVNKIKNIFQDCLNYMVDPEKNYYSNNFENIIAQIETTMGEKIAAIDSDGGINYKDKGLAYDSYLTAFILGSGGKISNWDQEQNTDNALVIRGLGGGSRKALQYCMQNKRTFYAIDTGYWQPAKKKDYHRITKNNLQYIGPIIERDANRLKLWEWKPKRFSPGKKILICPPSNKVMELWNQPTPEEWTKLVIKELKEYTDRPIEVRLKPNRTERVTNKTIWQALQDDVHCLITYNSIAATEALLAGKPAIALGPNAAQVLCNSKLSEIEKLYIPTQDEIFAFAKHLSYCQFTEREMQSGYAWNIVNEISGS